MDMGVGASFSASTIAKNMPGVKGSVHSHTFNIKHAQQVVHAHCHDSVFQFYTRSWITIMYSGHSVMKG